ncbi:uncharacterized protein LOC121848068 [Callorhinchus milii]|nr:uncharacterized protein LOC121848068 [Callorhinchus milii]
MDHICEYEFTVGSSLPFSNQQRFSNSLGFSISESSGISYRTGQNDVCGEECYNLQERSAVHLSPGFQDSTSPVLNGHGSTSPYIPLRKLQDLASMIPTRFSDSTEARQWLDSPQDSVTQDCCVTDKDSCSPSESDSTPEVKLKITKMVMNGKMMFESAICSEVETEDGKGSDEQSPGIEDREAPVLHRAKRMRKKSVKYSPSHETEEKEENEMCSPALPPVERRKHCVGRRKKVIPVRFEVGDLIWAKFSRRPWWPGTVCLDPLLKIHTKMKDPSRRPCRQYHVQFFGIVTEHAWVASAVVEPFEGRHQYELLVQRNAKNSDDVPRNKISAKVYTQWEAGLVQAEEVLSMSHEDRKSKYCLIGEKNLLPRSEGQTCGIQLYSEPKDIIKATNSGNHVKESEDCHRHNKKNKISTNAKNAKNSSDCKLGKTVRSKFSKSRDPVKDSAHCLYSTNNIVNNLQMNSAILINGVNEAPDELVTGVEGMSTKSSYTVESSSQYTSVVSTSEIVSAATAVLNGTDEETTKQPLKVRNNATLIQRKRKDNAVQHTICNGFGARLEHACQKNHKQARTQYQDQYNQQMDEFVLAQTIEHSAKQEQRRTEQSQLNITELTQPPFIAATAEGKRQRKPSKKLLESTEDYDQLFIPKKKLKPGFDPLHQGTAEHLERSIQETESQQSRIGSTESKKRQRKRNFNPSQSCPILEACLSTPLPELSLSTLVAGPFLCTTISEPCFSTSVPETTLSAPVPETSLPIFVAKPSLSTSLSESTFSAPLRELPLSRHAAETSLITALVESSLSMPVTAPVLATCAAEPPLNTPEAEPAMPMLYAESVLFTHDPEPSQPIPTIEQSQFKSSVKPSQTLPVVERSTTASKEVLSSPVIEDFHCRPSANAALTVPVVDSLSEDSSQQTEMQQYRGASAVQKKMQRKRCLTILQMSPIAQQALPTSADEAEAIPMEQSASPENSERKRHRKPTKKLLESTGDFDQFVPKKKFKRDLYHSFKACTLTF